MGWRDLFRRPTTPPESPPPPHYKHCSFCGKPRVEVATLISGPNVSICDACVVLSGAIVDEEAIAKKQSPWSWASIVGEMAAQSDLFEQERILEPLTRAAIALWQGNVARLRELAMRLNEKQNATTARAVLLISDAMGTLSMGDAERAVVAAIGLGEFEIAERHAANDPADHPVALALVELPRLLRMRDGDPEAAIHADRVRAAGRLLAEDAPLPERMTIDVILALAELRCGMPSASIKHYDKYEDQMQPWHALAHGDAHHALGNTGEARAEWERIAKDRLYPYWADEASRRLGDSPYR